MNKITVSSSWSSGVGGGRTGPAFKTSSFISIVIKCDEDHSGRALHSFFLRSPHIPISQSEPAQRLNAFFNSSILSKTTSVS